MKKPYEAAMYDIGHSQHSTLAAARRGLAKLRRKYRLSRQSMPFPRQVIRRDGKVIEVYDGMKD